MRLITELVAGQSSRDLLEPEKRRCWQRGGPVTAWLGIEKCRGKMGNKSHANEVWTLIHKFVLAFDV